VRRAAFVCVEGIEKNLVESVLDRLGQQLCKPGWASKVDCGGDLGKAEQEIARALTEQPTLLVVDNMESILPPPYIERPEALAAEAQAELAELLGLCERLSGKGETRVVFTSREPLPAPFGGDLQRRELSQLAREDAVKMVEAVLAQGAAGAGATSDAATEAIEQLVDAVHCHARTLTLLAPALRSLGVKATQEKLAELMAEMDKHFPNSREKSVYASVELSLRRMSPANREKARVLAVFHGGVDLSVIRTMMKWEESDVTALARELVTTGLATPDPYNHLSLNPALCPYLRLRMEQTEIEPLTSRWVEAMLDYVEFLVQEAQRHAEAAATLTVLELPNLIALLELVQAAGDAEATIVLTSSLYGLLQRLGRPRLLDRVAQAREASLAALGETWNRARFEAMRTRIEQQLASRQLRPAFAGAQDLLRRSQAAGEEAYQGADYDLAMACNLLGLVLRTVGGSEQALPVLAGAQTRFEAVERSRPGCGAARMASVCISHGADCLLELGRLDEAAAAYEETIQRAGELADERQVAAAKGNLGTVRMRQGRSSEAIQAYEEARESFGRLGEQGTVSEIWHQIGMVYEKAGQPEAAEDAYRKSLVISVQVGALAGQALTLTQLGNVYDVYLGRIEEAAKFLRQAADKFVEIGDVAREGVARNNLAGCLRKLRRLDEAKQEIHRAIECKAQFGHASTPWKAWSLLAAIETDSGNLPAAVQAKQKAIDCYLAYRRDGGENHYDDGRLVFAMTERLAAGGPAAAFAFLQQVAVDPDLPAQLRPFIQALQAILNGSRDRSLATAPDLNYGMAAEILLLIETLDRPSLAPSH